MSKIVMNDLVIELDARARNEVHGGDPKKKGGGGGMEGSGEPYDPNAKDLHQISENPKRDVWIDACHNTDGCESPGDGLPWSGKMQTLTYGFATLLLLTMLFATARADVVDYQRTIVVSPIGVPAQNGIELLAALDSIVDAGPTNPYLLKIEPGVYDLGANVLEMQEYVDIEGSGELVTTITANGQSGFATGTVIGADNAELRFITIENIGGDGVATALYSDGAGPQLKRVTIRAIDDSGGASRVTAMRVVGGAYLRIRDANLVARGGPNSIATGLWISNTLGVYITDTVISAVVGAQAYGLSTSGKVVTMRDVRIDGKSAAVLTGAPDAASRSLRISHALLTVSGGGKPAINNDAGAKIRLSFCELDLRGGGPEYQGTAPEEQKFCFSRPRFQRSVFNTAPVFDSR